MNWFISLFCRPDPSEPEDIKASLLDRLVSISREVNVRSGCAQLGSLEKDGTVQTVENILKELAQNHNFSLYKLESTISSLNIRLYSVPVPPDFVSINPRTKFQYHRMLKVFLGTSLDWEVWKVTASKEVQLNLDDTGFGEKRMLDEL